MRTCGTSPNTSKLTLPVNCVASRVTNTCRFVYELIDVNVAGPKS